MSWREPDAEPDWLLPAWDDRCPSDPDEPRRAPRSPARHVRAAGPDRDRGQPGDPGPVRADDGLRDLWVEGEVGRVTVSTRRPRVLHAQGRPSPAPVRLVPRRPGRARRSSRRPGSRSSPTGGWTCSSRRARSSSTSTALQPSGFGNLALRFEELKARARGGGPVRCGAQAAAARPGRATIAVITSPTGAVWRDVCKVLARRWPMARVVLVACQVQGDGAPASIVGALRRLERWIDAERERRAAARRGPGRDDPRPRRRLARGPVVVQRRARRARRRRAPDPGRVRAWATRSTSRSPTSPRTSGRRRRSAAAELVVPDRLEVIGVGPPRSAGAPRRAADRGARPPRGASSTRSDGRSTRLEPAGPARRVARARRPAARPRGARRRRAPRRGAARPGAAAGRGSRRCCPPASTLERRRLDGARRPGAARRPAAPRGRARRRSRPRAASLGALGPQATLERGYAIVRRAARRRDRARPDDAPAGSAQPRAGRGPARRDERRPPADDGQGVA